MLNAVTDYAEALNQAIDLIVAQRISEIPQDETVICTVVDDSDKENGHYKVAPNDSIIYDAYTDVKTYSIDSRVYVLTPKDGSPRTIVSRYLGDKDSSPVEYVSPKNYLIPQGDEYPIESFDGAVEIDRSFLDRTRLYNALYVSAEFKVPLDGVADPEQDYYALKIIGTNSANQSREFSLDSNQMFGDPFNYMGYFKQDQCFKYSITEDFTSLKVFLVTNGKSTGKVQVRNISLQFGFETATAIKDQIELTSYDALSYSPTDTSSLTKNLNLLWYNLDGNKYIGFEDGEFDLIKAQVEPEDEKVYYAIQWYLDNKDGSQELKKSTDTEVDTTFDFTCDATKATQTIKAIMWRNGKQYTDSIEFTNSASVEVTPPEIAGLEIAIKHGEKSLDVYPYYGADNQLIDPAQSYLSREIYFDWSTTSGIVEAEYWKDATLYWYVPKNATMLSVGHLNKLESIPEGDNMIKEGYDGYRVVDASDIEHRSFYYSISSLYNVAFTNNTILCVAKKGDRTWQAQLTPTFSSIGSSGTDYTIAFSIEGGHPGFVEGIHGESNPLKITAQLYDPDGQKVEGDEYCQTKELAKYPDVIAEQIWTVSMEALWRGQTVKLSASYPIAKLSRADIYASIPTTVVYDNLGTTASYYKGLLALFEKSNNAEVENLTWQVVPEGVKYAPKIVNGALAVPSLYISGIEEIAIEAIQGSAVIWHQPLIITQNRYASQFLNDWDGSLEIDDENNTIMASMLGAGKKEDDNSFTGVLMGDVGKKGGTTTTGLYGYHQGVQSFGFDTDGTAFIGKEGKGRILFDGNESVIKSAGWDDDHQLGTLLNLDKGELQLVGEKGWLKFVNGELKLQLESFDMIVGGSGSDAESLDKHIANKADTQIETSMSNGSLSIKFTEIKDYTDQQVSGVEQSAVEAAEAAESAYNLAKSAEEAGVELGKNYAELSGTIDSIQAEVSHSASYFGTCSTPQSGENSHIKVIDLPVPSITDFNYDNVFMQNRTIAIQFAYSEQPTNTNTTTYVQTIVTENAYTKNTYYVKSGESYVLATGDFSATATYYYAVSTLTKVGRELSLKINNKTHKVYINGEVTSATNPFGWAKGNVVYFTYQGTNSENGYWLVSDSGSYSNILQTAYDITSSVSSLDGKLSSQIIQTSTEIRSEVTNLETNVSSTISQTENRINLKIENGDKDVTTAFEAADGAIRQSIIDKETGLYAEIEATAAGINSNVGLIAADVEGLGIEVDKLKLSPIVYYCEGDYDDDTTEWTVVVNRPVTDFKSGDIVQVKFLSEKSSNSLNEIIYFIFAYRDDQNNAHFIGGAENPTKFSVRGDYLRWFTDETLAFVYTGDTFLLTYVSQSQIEQTATSIAASVSSVRGYAALIYDYDYVELDPSLATCLFRAEFSPEVQITTLPTGTIIALKCDEALSLEEWEKCQGQISIWFQQDATEFGPFQIKDTPHWLEGDEVYFMLTVDMLGDPYLRPTSPISTAQTEMLSDMISARVVNGATGNGFGWNLDAESFTLQASVTDANGTTTQTEVLKCDANGLTITGTINALAGKIGGWEINAYKIFGGKPKVTKDDEAQCCVVQVPGYEFTPGSHTKWVFAAGSKTHDSYGEAPFRVDRNGSMYASAGYIGGWKITSNSLESSNGKTKFTTSNNGGLTLAGSFVYQGHTIIVESDTGYLRAYT